MIRLGHLARIIARKNSWSKMSSKEIRTLDRELRPLRDRTPGSGIIIEAPVDMAKYKKSRMFPRRFPIPPFASSSRRMRFGRHWILD